MNSVFCQHTPFWKEAFHECDELEQRGTVTMAVLLTVPTVVKHARLGVNFV